MDLDAARTVLGVSAGDDWSVVRDAYRTLVRTTHPDLHGEAGVDLTVQVNAAYRALAVARRDGRLHAAGVAEPGGAPPAPSRPSWRPRPTGAPIVDDIRIVGGDTIVLSSTPSETFRRLVEATSDLGEISYVDRSSAIFEAVVRLEDGTPASFVVSLQWRAHDATCEAFCTLEALDRAEALDVSGVVEQLVAVHPSRPGGMTDARPRRVDRRTASLSGSRNRSNG